MCVCGGAAYAYADGAGATRCAALGEHRAFGPGAGPEAYAAARSPLRRFPAGTVALLLLLVGWRVGRRR